MAVGDGGRSLAADAADVAGIWPDGHGPEGSRTVELTFRDGSVYSICVMTDEYPRAEAQLVTPFSEILPRPGSIEEIARQAESIHQREAVAPFAERATQPNRPVCDVLRPTEAVSDVARPAKQPRGVAQPAPVPSGDGAREATAADTSAEEEDGAT